MDISIHALREEGDCASNHMGVIADIFLSTPSARRATRRPRCRCRPAANFYPRPPRGGRLRILNNFNNVELFLSTPSARRATHRIQVQLRQLPISIHALREEGDPLQILGPGLQIQFLSTPSARRATCSSLTSRRSTTISIHALREEGDCSDTVHHRCCRYFYPRPPRGGRPSVLKTGPRPILYFYPRPPRGGRLTWEIVAAACISISIHALREEGDPRRLRRCLLPCHFYPRPPRGGRPPSGA